VCSIGMQEYQVFGNRVAYDLRMDWNFLWIGNPLARIIWILEIAWRTICTWESFG
jgi:hypothetical protein